MLMRSYSAVLLVLLSVLSGYRVHSEFGVDVSSLTQQLWFQCLLQNGYTYAIVRAWKKDATPDTNCPATVQNAWNAGMHNVDVYWFPCPLCGDPQGQITSSVNYLAANSVNYTTFWLDVEGLEYWSTNLTWNQEFFASSLSKANQLGVRVGIYTSKYMWTSIMGNTYAGGAAYPLWYPRYNNLSNYDDFSPFGGWTTPVMKQFQANTGYCGAFVDFNWYPPSPTPSVTPSVTPSRSSTPSTTPTPTRTPSTTPSMSVTPSISPSSSVTPSISVSPTNTPSPSRTATPSKTPSSTPSITPSITPSRTPSETPSVTPYNLKRDNSADGAVVGGVAAGAVGGGLLAAGAVIGGYILVTRRRKAETTEEELPSPGA